MAILLRTDKGAKLTYAEADENFSSLFYSASISGNTLYLYYTGSQYAPQINPVTIDIPQGSSRWTQNNDGSISRNSAVNILGNTRIIGAVTGSILKIVSLPVGTSENRILVSDAFGNVRYRTDLQLQGTQGIQGLTGAGAQGATGTQGTQGLTGNQGIQGFTGDQGLGGVQGIQGVQGTQGIQGLQGSQGTQGIQGLPGIQGTQGTQGVQGTQGTQGVTGTQGLQGITGSQGATGMQGTQGIQGLQGPQGIQGTQGTEGLQGVVGAQGIQGTQGIQGVQGFVGDTGLGFTIAKTYISVAALLADSTPIGISQGQFAIVDTGTPEDPENSRLYIWDGVSYTYVNDLSGAAGIQGVQGIVGTQGTNGSQGITGSQGTAGIQGIQGELGTQGTQGISVQGLQGIQGISIQGLQGTIGSQGTTGAQGITGTGTQGTTGSQGATGTQGTTGSTSFNAGTVGSVDDRQLAPADLTSYRMGFGFTSWNNNNGSPYADYLHLRSYSDSSGGSDNLVTFLKSGIGMRIWQQTFGSTTAYSSFADVLHSSNFNSYAPTLTGTGASGTWGINVTGTAGGVAWTNVSGRPTAVSSFTNDSGYITSDSTKLPLTGGTLTGGLQGTTATLNSITLNQNPVGSTYGAGQGGPPNSFYQPAGNDDGFRIYAESPATNRVRAVFQIEDDMETESEQWVFRNKMTYSGLSATTSVSISGAGTLTAAQDIVAYSDKRVKENINTIDNALEKVKALRGVTYNRTDKSDKSEKIGVIAQEIQEVLPQVVHEQEDGMLGVSYGNIVAVLIEAIKEQQKQIDELMRR